MTDKVEITVRVEVKNTYDGNSEMEETVEAVRSCLNGNRSNNYFRTVDIIDAELKEDSW